jgi:hypothetical protein
VAILARMHWWSWALVWFGLLAGAGLVLGLLVRTLWFKVKALTVELNEASTRLTAVLAAVNDAAEQDDPGGEYDGYDEVAHRSGARTGRSGGARRASGQAAGPRRSEHDRVTHPR